MALEYRYTTSGSLKICGCSINEKVLYIKAKFKEGDAAYEMRQAKKGIVEKLIIKSIVLVNNARTGGLFQINYIDSFNAVYLEQELADQEEAVALAIDYYEKQQELAEVQLQKAC